jgi:hypothetical protein
VALLGSTADGGQCFFVRGHLSKILNMFLIGQNNVSEQKFLFFYSQTMDFCPKTDVFGQKSINPSSALGLRDICARFTPDARVASANPTQILRVPAAQQGMFT